MYALRVTLTVHATFLQNIIRQHQSDVKLYFALALRISPEREKHFHDLPN